jgi:enamine deaminase RidA (YjgF/YER057c/UK114 family)
MPDRLRVSTGTSWEAAVGYSRAIRVGNTVWTAGTTATDNDGVLVGPGDPYLQMRQCLLRIQAALAEAGARMEDVVRVEIFVTDISQWQEIGRAHAEFFGEIRPANFMVEVAALVDPEMLVEVAVTAVIDEGGA